MSPAEIHDRAVETLAQRKLRNKRKKFLKLYGNDPINWRLEEEAVDDEVTAIREQLIRDYPKVARKRIFKKARALIAQKDLDALSDQVQGRKP